MTDLGYKESERDRGLKPYTWESAQRLTSGLAVSGVMQCLTVWPQPPECGGLGADW